MLEMEAQEPSAGAGPGLPRPVRPGPLPAPDRDVLDSARARLTPARTRSANQAGTAANPRAAARHLPRPLDDLRAASAVTQQAGPARATPCPGRAARYRGRPGPAEQRAAVCGPAGSQPARAGPAGRDELGPDRGHYRRPGGRGQGPPVGYAAPPGARVSPPKRRAADWTAAPKVGAADWTAAPKVGAADWTAAPKVGAADWTAAPKVGAADWTVPGEWGGGWGGTSEEGRRWVQPTGGARKQSRDGRTSMGRRSGPARLIGRLSQPVSGS